MKRWSKAGHQLLEAREHLGVDAIADARPVFAADDEAGFAQDLEVLRHRGLGQGQLLEDVARDAGVLFDEQA